MEDIIKKVLEFIETTGSVLIKEGFELAVRQVIINNTVNLIFLLILLLVVISVNRRHFKVVMLFNKGKELHNRYSDFNKETATIMEKKAIKAYNSMEEGMLGLITVFVIGIDFLVLIISFSFLPNYIIQLLNPQWYAIQTIIGLIK